MQCNCGKSSGEAERHVMDGSYVNPSGNNRYKPCYYCNYLIDTWSGEIFPILRENEIMYVRFVDGVAIIIINDEETR